MSKKLIDRPTEIRDDEKLNNSKLFEYLSEIIDLDIESFDILQFPSGYSNLTYLIKSNEKEYVLRKPPHGAKIKSGHDMSREFKVLSSLKDHYHKTPDPIHYCSNTDIIGSDFYLMERVKGVILRSNNYSQIVKDKSQFNFLAEQFVDSFVELHKLDINKIGLSDFGNPEGYNSRQVYGWCKRYNNSKIEELKEMEIVMDWLKSNISQSKYVSLIHNDFKYDNLVLDENDLSIHLSTIFTENRLKKYIELRSMDTCGWDCLCAGPAFNVGMLYGNLDEVYELISNWDKDKIMNAYLEAPQKGFNTQLMGKDLLYWSSILLDLSKKGLEKRDIVNKSGKNETIFLNHLQKVIDNKTTNADHMIIKFSKDEDLTELYDK